MARIGERLTRSQSVAQLAALACFLWAPRRRVTLSALSPCAPRAGAPIGAAGRGSQRHRVALALGSLARRSKAQMLIDGELLARSIEAVDRDLDSMHPMIEQRLGMLAAAAMPTPSCSVPPAPGRSRNALIEDDPYLARAAQPGSIMEQAVCSVRRRLLAISMPDAGTIERTAEESFSIWLPEWETWAWLNSSANRCWSSTLSRREHPVSKWSMRRCAISQCTAQWTQAHRAGHDMFIWLRGYLKALPRRAVASKNVQAGIAGI